MEGAQVSGGHQPDLQGICAVVKEPWLAPNRMDCYKRSDVSFPVFIFPAHPAICPGHSLASSPCGDAAKGPSPGPKQMGLHILGLSASKAVT